MFSEVFGSSQGLSQPFPQTSGETRLQPPQVGHPPTKYFAGIEAAIYTPVLYFPRTPNTVLRPLTHTDNLTPVTARFSQTPRVKINKAGHPCFVSV